MLINLLMRLRIFDRKVSMTIDLYNFLILMSWLKLWFYYRNEKTVAFKIYSHYFILLQIFSQKHFNYHFRFLLISSRPQTNIDKLIHYENINSNPW
jgi:hypothetical protein